MGDLQKALNAEPKIYLGTSAFTAAGWPGTFYPPEIKSKDYLSFYAQRFDTVEVNSTLYGCPSPRTVENWAAKTPNNFIFSIKTPRSITHDKILANCDAELEEFLTTMEILGPKLGPILFQFPQFSPGVFADRHAFTDRLIPFLKKLPAGPKYAIEIRNPEWLDAEFADLLRQRQIALALPDLPYMPRPEVLAQKFDPLTADWTYIRWLGDRKGIELQTVTWDKIIVDRTAELTSWVDFCYRIKNRGIPSTATQIITTQAMALQPSANSATSGAKKDSLHCPSQFHHRHRQVLRRRQNSSLRSSTSSTGKST